MTTVPEAASGSGRQDRFDALYRATYEPIFRYVLRRAGGDRDSVADLVAEVFVVALRRQDAIPEPPDDRLWLYGVARRVLLGHNRRRARRFRLESRLRAEAKLTSRQAGDDRSEVVRIRAAMEQLRGTDREALQLVVWDGLSHAEAARVLGCTANAVALRVRKARSRLRTLLSDDGANASPKPLGSHHSGLQQGSRT
jgi:RNA polymerase sigma-70 factor, ECF subfamily